MPADTLDLNTALKQLDAAATDGKLSRPAVANIRVWLTDPRYVEYAPQVAEHLASGKFKELDDAFWTVIPFGTGGRRGRMYPIGTNAINDRTIGESAQGLADYVREQNSSAESLACAIAYDTRHRSRDFAELCSEVMVAAGFKVYFLNGYRSTPELSFTVRHKKCACGIMVTASHNPPSDNAVKAYWSTGGQLLPPHDHRVIERVMDVTAIQRVPFAKALGDGRIVYCQQEVDVAYLAALAHMSQPGPRDLKIIYSPMHGVGASAVMPALEQAGFQDVELFGPHAQPDGNFPNVPGHVSNPENPATFDSMIARAKESGAELILSTDPDADRLGCAAPIVKGGAWGTFTGNQIAALLADYMLDQLKRSGKLSPKNYLVKTLVTTELLRRIGDSYGVKTYGNLLVGFKWIAGTMDDVGPDNFVLGAEESHGFLVGHYARDKDAPVAAMLLAELAAACKAAGQTLHEKLDSLFWQHGVHLERTTSRTMPGSEGMAKMQQLMAGLRSNPPQSLGGIPVKQIRDYEQQRIQSLDGKIQQLDGPPGDLVIFDLEKEGNYVAVRPSGTEPKVKFYLFAYEAPEMLANLEDAKSELAVRLDAFEADLNGLSS